MAMSIDVQHNSVSINSVVEYTIGINYGRTDPTQSCNPATCSLRVIYSGSALDPSDFQLGDEINVRQLNTGQPTISMFRGTITNMRADHHTIQIQCVSKWLGSLARTFINMPAYENVNLQSVGQAALTAAVAAGAPIGASWTVNPKLYNVTVPAQNNVSALSYLQALEQSEPFGLVREYPGGFVSFAGYNQRRISSLAATQKFLWSTKPQWGYDWSIEKASADFRNLANVNYTAGIESYSDSASITAKGQFAQSLNTYIVEPLDADYVAINTVRHGLNPQWRTSGLSIRLEAFTDLERYTVLENMRTGSYIETPTFSASAGTQFFVEGWTDQIQYNSGAGVATWLRTFSISEITATKAAQRYQDVSASVTYASVNATYRWVDLVLQDI